MAAVVLLPGMIAMGAMFGLFGNIIIKVMDVFAAIFPIIPLLFNPVALANEIITGVILGLTLVMEAVFGFLNPAKYSKTPEERKDSHLENAPKTCYKTSILNILLLIVCPPFAVWQSRGFGALHEIFFCTLLTIYGYYFPGLIYAIMAVNLKCTKA